ncbi:MAG: hypothetical protein ACPHGZ_05875 [Schleiferiaceae bacterium]
MKRIATICIALFALALSSCGTAKDCDCPSFSQQPVEQTTKA